MRPLDEKMFQQALSQMVHPLGGEEVILEPVAYKQLLRACELVWNELGIDFSPVESYEWKELPISEQIVRIAKQGKVRTQEVKLEEGWWKRDGLALLGFYNDRPVALLWHADEYWIADPATGSREKVTKEAAQQISPAAYAFLPTVSIKDFSLWKMGKALFKGSLIEVFKLVVFLLVIAALGLALPVINKVFFDVVIPDLDLSLYAQLLTGLFLISCAIAVLTYVSYLLYLRLEGKTNHRMQGLIWDHLLRLSPTFFRRHSTGDLIQRLTIVTSLRELIGQNSLRIILAGFMGLIYLIPMFWFSWIITLFIIGMTAILFILILILSPRLYHLNLAILRLDSWINTSLIHFFTNIGELRNFQAERRGFAAWSEKFGKRQKKQLQLNNLKVVINSLLNSMPTLSLLLLFIGFFFFYIHEETPLMSIGQFMGFQTALAAFTHSFFSGVEGIISNIALFAEWHRIKTIWVDAPEKPKMGSLKGEIKGNIEIDSITFTYEYSHLPVLKNLSASIKAGELCVVTGPSGSGKTTLLRLLSNLEEPNSGVIRFEGIALKDWDRDTFKTQVASILQTSQVFSGSLIENITCGRKLDEEKLAKTLKLSTFDTILPDLPMGLNTQLTTGGKLLSSGQQQRLLLARALYSDPAVLILDEATSAVDLETQERLFSNLKGRTLIIATHEEALWKIANQRIDLTEREVGLNAL
jgi:ABC-type bacteriocin/lantibiotic exporter with double-glycine peptidase domain